MSRAEVRASLAAMLAALPGVQAVYPWMANDFGAQSPVILVASDGTLRQRFTPQGSHAEPHYITLHVFALYQDAAGTWAGDSAETTLDTIEQAVADLLDANQVSLLWRAIRWTGRSTVNNVIIGGVEYRHEVIPLEVYPK